MKVLWVNTNFMHPTNKGGSIRSIEMLRYLHQWHEIHYVAIADPAHPEGPGRAGEYSFRAYPFSHQVSSKTSPTFYWEVVKGLFSPLPLAMKRYSSPALGDQLRELMARERFDRAVVDHLTPGSYFPHLERSLLFQHNVETTIWRRHVEQAGDPLRRFYFAQQARRMFDFEGRVCRAAGHIVAVSATDAQRMRELFGVTGVSEIPTGVNLEYYTPTGTVPPSADMVFVGSMDWLANIDGVTFFVNDILPIIRRRLPDATFAVVGRNPGKDILAMAARDPKIIVTGTVPDIRPFLWGAGVSVVPLRIGGGTRLKVYESMAARVPLVSTTVGAEGLDYEPGVHIAVADTAEAFADACIRQLEDRERARQMAATAWQMVADRSSWEQVARTFDRIMIEKTPSATPAP